MGVARRLCKDKVIFSQNYCTSIEVPVTVHYIIVHSSVLYFLMQVLKSKLI